MALWDRVKNAGSKVATGISEAAKEVKGDEHFTVEELQNDFVENGVCAICLRNHPEVKGE